MALLVRNPNIYKATSVTKDRKFMLRRLDQIRVNFINCNGKPNSVWQTNKFKIWIGIYNIRPRSVQFIRGISQKFTKSTSKLTLVGFALFRNQSSKADDIIDRSKEVMENIPKEVFYADKAKKKKKQWFFIGLFSGLWDTFWFWVRFAKVSCIFIPLFMVYPFTKWSHNFTVKWWDWILSAMEYLGPTFIKLGQWAGTRRDLFADEFCDMCSRLHSSTRQHAFYITKRKLRKAFGKRWRQIFMKIEKEPIGSGCIAQVHRGYMDADMIPDESVIDEVLSLEDDEEPGIDLAEGFEVIGFSKVNDYLEQIEDYHSDYSDGQSPRKTKESSIIETGSGVILDPKYTKNPPSDSVEIVPHIKEFPLIQTDKGTLIPVAIKVLHPGVYRSVERDLAILRFVAGVLEFVFPSLRWISVKDCVKELSDLMTSQIDLRFEAECLERFIENFEENPHVRFPRPIWPYCKRDVLVETLEIGEPIGHFVQSTANEDTDPATVQSREETKKKIASLGVDALLQMIFVDNLIHGDLHPGNIFVQNAPTQSHDDNKLMLIDIGDTAILVPRPTENPMRLVFLDVGITSALYNKDKENFRDVFTAVVKGEGEKVGKLMVEHASCTDCVDKRQFEKELGELVTSFRSQSISLKQVQVQKLLSGVFSICYRHKVKMESNFVSIVLAIFVLEGLGRSLDPELDILEKARPFLLAEAIDEAKKAAADSSMHHQVYQRFVRFVSRLWGKEQCDE